MDSCSNTSRFEASNREDRSEGMAIRSSSICDSRVICTEEDCGLSSPSALS